MMGELGRGERVDVGGWVGEVSVGGRGSEGVKISWEGLSEGGGGGAAGVRERGGGPRRF